MRINWSMLLSEPTSEVCGKEKVCFEMLADHTDSSAPANTNAIQTDVLVCLELSGKSCFLYLQAASQPVVATLEVNNLYFQLASLGFCLPVLAAVSQSQMDTLSCWTGWKIPMSRAVVALTDCR